MSPHLNNYLFSFENNSFNFKNCVCIYVPPHVYRKLEDILQESAVSVYSVGLWIDLGASHLAKTALCAELRL